MDHLYRNINWALSGAVVVEPTTAYPELKNSKKSIKFIVLLNYKKNIKMVLIPNKANGQTTWCPVPSLPSKQFKMLGKCYRKGNYKSVKSVYLSLS